MTEIEIGAEHRISHTINQLLDFSPTLNEQSGLILDAELQLKGSSVLTERRE
jgi:hypothetical protein